MGMTLKELLTKGEGTISAKEAKALVYFVEKAKSYLEKIDAINPEASNDVIEY